LKKGISIIVGIVTDEKIPTGKTVERITGIGGIEAIYEVTGDFDVFALASSGSVNALNALLEKIRATEGVVSTMTYLVLSMQQSKAAAKR
jgi:Lrp/AsnC family transcriptional regulator of lysine biosynthesis